MVSSTLNQFHHSIFSKADNRHNLGSSVSHVLPKCSLGLLAIIWKGFMVLLA